MSKENTITATIEKVQTDPNRPPKSAIVIKDHIEFEGGTKCQFVNTIDLSKEIHNLFSGIFSDYYGCKICMNTGNPQQVTAGVLNTVPPQGLYVNLYFKDMPVSPNGIKSIVIPGSKESSNSTDKEAKSIDNLTKNNGMMERLSHVMSSVGSKTYEVTPETREALEPLMFRPNVRWADHIREMASQMNPLTPGRQEAVVVISGLSLDAVVAELYGRSTPKGDFYYEIVPVNYVVNSRDEFLLRITQMDKKVVRDMRDSLGIYNAAANDFHVYNR